MVFKLNQKQVSKKEFGANWKREEIKKMLRNEYRKRTDKNKTVFLGIGARDLYNKFYTGEEDIISNDSKWKSRIKTVLNDCIKDAGFSLRSSLENTNNVVRIDYTNSYYIIKIELYPVTGV